MTEPHFMTIAEASAAIRARRLSPVELTQSFLSRVKSLDGRFDSYLMVLEEAAIAAAKQAEREITAGQWKGPLHGIPIGLKDIYNTAGDCRKVGGASPGGYFRVFLRPGVDAWSGF